MTIKTNGRTIYYDECDSRTRYFVLDDFEPKSFATLGEAKDAANNPSDQPTMRTKTTRPKQTIRQLREALWYVEDNPKESFEDVTACLMVLHDAVQELINHHDTLSHRSTVI